MSPRRRQRPRQRIAVIYGESPNDSDAIAELILAVDPSFPLRPTPRRKPLVLIKNAPLERVAERAETIAQAVRVEEALNDVVCVFAHEDCDDLEPAHEEVAAKIEDALRRAGCDAHAVVPAWELEAWWFLWPEAVAAVNPSWDSLNSYRGRRTGLIADAKEELKRALTRSFDAAKKKRVRTYSESDAPSIARVVKERALADAPAGRSDSWERFRTSVAACAEA